MTQETFVEAIKTAVAHSAVTEVINEMKQPPGRKPSPEMLERSKWFNELTETQREMVQNVIVRAVRGTVFGFFAVLDNVRTIEAQGSRGELELFFVKEGHKMRLNSPDQAMLHDIYNQV